MRELIKKIDRIVETIKIKIRRKYISLTARYRQKKIKYKDFSIISNNCWAGFVYQSYNLPYNTPTIGMFIVSDDYIKLIGNLQHYMEIDKFMEVEPQESKWYEELKDISKYGEYPIAKLDDIELHLLHYTSVKEAEEAWNRRKRRINYKRIIYKFSEMNLCKEKNILDFQKLNLENKICFISSKFKELENEYTIIVNNNKINQIKSTDEPVGDSKKININGFINSLK